MVKRARMIAMLMVAASVFAFAGAAAAETRLTFSTGFNYSSGDYGDVENTEVYAIPLSARLTAGDWSIRVSAPYLQVTGPADIADTTDGSASSGGSGTGSTGTVARTGTERGIGDTTLSVERTFSRIGGSNAYVEVAARVRLPTGDEDKGLGVGATDYTLNAELGASTRDGGAYVYAGRRFLGDRDDLDRQDGWQAGFGGWIPVGDQTRVGAFASWREASVEGNDDPAEAGAFVTFRLTEQLRMSVTASGGLSEASPDYSAGIRFTWRTQRLDR